MSCFFKVIVIKYQCTHHKLIYSAAYSKLIIHIHKTIYHETDRTISNMKIIHIKKLAHFLQKFKIIIWNSQQQVQINIMSVRFEQSMVYGIIKTWASFKGYCQKISHGQIVWKVLQAIKFQIEWNFNSHANPRMKNLEFNKVYF